MVNVFVPFDDFFAIAETLDKSRLYKQVVECKQIMNALQAKKEGRKVGYQNHPATRMWEGYEQTLRVYQLILLHEWMLRTWNYEVEFPEAWVNYAYDNLPEWFDDTEVLRSHRANLYRKDPEHYAQFEQDFKDWGGHTDRDTNELTCEKYKWPV